MTKKTYAQVVAAAVVVAGQTNNEQLKAMTAEVAAAEQGSRGIIAQAVLAAMSHLVAHGTTKPINALLTALNPGNRLMVESLISVATVYKVESIFEAKIRAADTEGAKDALKIEKANCTLKLVTGKEEGARKGKDKEAKAAIEEGAAEYWEHFVTTLGGCIWKWAETKKKEVKDSRKESNKAARDAKLAKMDKSEKFDAEAKRMNNMVEKSEYMSDDLKAQIKALIKAEQARILAAEVAGEPEVEAEQVVEG